jgi:hypothetical protein
VVGVEVGRVTWTKFKKAKRNIQQVGKILLFNLRKKSVKKWMRYISIYKRCPCSNIFLKMYSFKIKNKTQVGAPI